MSDLIAKLLRRAATAADPTAEQLALLIRAAQQDAAFRQRLVALLQFPHAQRRALIETALEQMRLRGEPVEAQAAFAALIQDDAAQVALQLLGAA